jgi:hypothetical protein
VLIAVLRQLPPRDEVVQQRPDAGIDRRGVIPADGHSGKRARRSTERCDRQA